MGRKKGEREKERERKRERERERERVQFMVNFELRLVPFSGSFKGQRGKSKKDGNGK